MSKTLAIVAATAAVIIAIPVVGFLAYKNAYDTANRMERTIEASHEEARNTLAQYGQKLQEAAQVPAMQADDVARILTQGLEARYGENGSQSAFQWIQEQNPNVDSAVYTRLQDIAESGRNDFKRAQTLLIDTKRAYTTALGSLVTGTLMGWGGYPTINVGFRGGADDFKIVSTSRANNAFETGEEDVIQLRPKN